MKADVEKETIWANLNQISSVFGVQKAAISKHIKNIYESNELSADATVSKMETVQKEGEREVVREIEYYNLDLIIAVGYRVNSKKATQFRQWATRTLRSYLVRGFVENIERLRELPVTILDDLEERIKIIRQTIQK